MTNLSVDRIVEVLIAHPAFTHETNPEVTADEAGLISFGDVQCQGCWLIIGNYDPTEKADYSIERETHLIFATHQAQEVHNEEIIAAMEEADVPVEAIVAADND